MTNLACLQTPDRGSSGTTSPKTTPHNENVLETDANKRNRERRDAKNLLGNWFKTTKEGRK